MGLFAGIKIHQFPLLIEEKEKQEPATCPDKNAVCASYCLYAGLLTSRNHKEIHISTNLKSVTSKLSPVLLSLKEFVRTSCPFI